MSKSAVPVLVEVKRATDTRLRREVVGQLLDYAANGVAFWPQGSLEQAFRQTASDDGDDADQRMLMFLGDDDPEEFWRQVDSNLSAGRVRLVVAADVIPSELARILEFLNEQMKADVIGVELNYYESDDGRRTLAPRIIGTTERAKAAKNSKRAPLPPITQEEWLAEHIAPRGDTVLEGAQAYRKLMSGMGATLFVASTQGSIGASWQTDTGDQAYPFFLQRNGTISIGFGWVKSRNALSSDESRQAYYDKFAEIVGPLSTMNAGGLPAFPATRLLNEETARSFEALAREFVADACRP